MKDKFLVKCADINLPVYTKIDNLVGSDFVSLIPNWKE